MKKLQKHFLVWGSLVLWVGSVGAVEMRVAPLVQPLTFEKNVGQVNETVSYLSRGQGYTLFLTPSEAVMAMSGGDDVLRMSLSQAEPAALPQGEQARITKSHYLQGKSQSGWRTGVPHFGLVRYASVYPGIDLVYHAAGKTELEYDFEVQAGADPESIGLRFGGMQSVVLDSEGNLVLRMPRGDIVQRAPVAYQMHEGVRRPVEAAFVIREGGDVGFRVASYDAGQPLIIDPIISFSTYLGDAGTDVKTIKVDTSGSVYVYGYTRYTGFPTTTGAYQSAPSGGTDAYIGKITADGTQFEFLTYLGGSADEGNGGAIGPQLALDSLKNIYVTGRTASTDFPLVNPLQGTMNGTLDFYVAKLTRDGSSIVYSTFLGGPDAAAASPSEASPTINVDASGNVYILGYTNGDGYPTVNAHQANWAGGLDPVITKLNARGSAILFSTYFGGSSDDKGRDIALDRSGNIYITGRADSSDFPLLNSLQAYRGRGDVFVSKFTTDGVLAFSTLWGGGNTEKGRAIVLDDAGNVYVTGNTQSTDFPVVSPYQRTLGGTGDMFVLKIEPTLSRATYSTYVGGADDDLGASIALDKYSNIYVTGYSKSTNFPLLNAFQPTLSGTQDAVLVKLSGRGKLLFSTYLGGSGADEAVAIGLDSALNIYLGGTTDSTDYPLLNPLQTGTAGVFVTKISP